MTMTLDGIEANVEDEGRDIAARRFDDLTARCN